MKTLAEVKLRDKKVREAKKFYAWAMKEYSVLRKKLELKGFTEIHNKTERRNIYLRVIEERLDHSDIIIGTFYVGEFYDDFMKGLLINPDGFLNKKMRVYAVYVDHNEHIDVAYHSTRYDGTKGVK